MIIRRDDNYAEDDDYKDGFDAYNFDDVNQRMDMIDYNDDHNHH